MKIYFLSISCSVLLYAILRIIMDGSGAEIEKRRISSLVALNEIENVHDEVLKEKREKKPPQKNRRLSSLYDKLRNNLSQSGIKLKATEFLCAWAALTLIPALFLLALGCSAVTAVGAGILGFSVPPVIVKRARSKRAILFDRQLGESLIILGNCIKSGYSFKQAMESISKDMQPPISVEFSRALREMNYGVKQEDALNHMVERVQSKDLDLLVSAIITSSQVGGNLSEILETISATIKDRIKIRDEVRILTSSGRTSGIIIGLLPAAIILFLMLINPEYIRSFTAHPLGRILIIAAAVLEFVGFTVVNKIVDIKY